MPVGLEVTNDSGVKMITQEFRNFHLIEKGTFTIPAGDSVLGGSYVFTRSGRTYPVLAIRATGLVGSAEQTVASGTLNRTFWTPLNAASRSVDFWLFDVQSSSPASFGLEVYNASGQLTYASGVGPMRVVSDAVMSGYTNLSASYASGRTYAAVQTFSGFAQDNTETVPDFWVTKRVLGMASWSGVTLTGKRNYTETKINEFDEDIPGFSYQNQSPRWLVLDVTDL